MIDSRLGSFRCGVALVCLAACAAPDDRPDARPSEFPPMIALPASQATFTSVFDAVIAGTANTPVGAVDLTHNVGSVGLDGTTTAFTYAQALFGPYTTYEGFALGPGRWDVFFAYCQDDALVTVWDEGVGGPGLFDAAASGACAASISPLETPVAVPAVTIAPPTPIEGYTVDGPAITVRDDGTGWLDVGDTHLPLLVFGDVDCSIGCGSPGWYELHSLLWDATAQRAVFAIVYLQLDQPGSVIVAYARALPDLGDPIGGVTLPATWTIPSVWHRRSRLDDGRPRGVPPPSARPI